MMTGGLQMAGFVEKFKNMWDAPEDEYEDDDYPEDEEQENGNGRTETEQRAGSSGTRLGSPRSGRRIPATRLSTSMRRRSFRSFCSNRSVSAKKPATLRTSC